jgi:hypothetical protein
MTTKTLARLTELEARLEEALIREEMRHYTKTIEVDTEGGFTGTGTRRCIFKDRNIMGVCLRGPAQSSLSNCERSRAFAKVFPGTFATTFEVRSDIGDETRQE